MSDDIIQEQDVPMEEETPLEDADLYQEDEQYIDELDRYQTDEDIEADVAEAARILRKKDSGNE